MKSNSGQAIVTLLFFMIFAITVTSAAVVVILTNSLSATKFDQGNQAYFVAEAGIENALIRLLRDPSYSGETLTLEGGTVTVLVTGTNTKTIQAISTLGNFSHQLQVIANYTNDLLSIQSWRQI